MDELILESDAVLERLRRGEVVENCVIEGLRLSGCCSEPVRLRDCLVRLLEVNGASFLGEVDFSRCTFPGTVHIEHASFHNRASFRGCVFEGPVELVDAHFDDHADFGGASFLDEADFSEAEFQTVEFPGVSFSGRVQFEHTHFDGWAEFGAARFRESALFKGAVFERGAGFGEVRFERDFDFTDAKFDRECSFLHAFFGGTADFDKLVGDLLDVRDSTFLGEMRMRGARIRAGFFDRSLLSGQASFSGTTAGKIRFRETRFDNGLLMTNAHVGGEANFDGMMVAGAADFCGVCLSAARFRGAVFDAAAFSGSLFSLDVTFEGTRFSEAATFRDARFGRDVSFEGASFADAVTFRSALFGGDVVLKGTTLGRPGDFREAQFGGQVTLLGVVAEELALDWKQISGHLMHEQLGDWTNAAAEFGLLKRFFEKRNAYDDMDEAYRMFKRCSRKARTGVLAELLRPLDYCLLDMGAGYGTRPWNITVLVGALVTLFAGCYFAFSDQVLDGGLRAGPQSFGYYLFYSLATFMTIGAENLHPDYQNWLKYVVAFEGFCGFFLMTLFVATFTRKVIR